MPITNEQLRNNYYISVVIFLCDGGPDYTANDPDTGVAWAFELMDNGDPPHPNPYIAMWEVKSHEQPSNETLMANTDEAQIIAAKEALFGTPSLKAGEVLFDPVALKKMAVLEDQVKALTKVMGKIAMKTPVPSSVGVEGKIPVEQETEVLDSEALSKSLLLAEEEIPKPKLVRSTAGSLDLSFPGSPVPTEEDKQRDKEMEQLREEFDKVKLRNNTVLSPTTSGSLKTSRAGSIGSLYSDDDTVLV